MVGSNFDRVRIVVVGDAGDYSMYNYIPVTYAHGAIAAENSATQGL